MSSSEKKRASSGPLDRLMSFFGAESSNHVSEDGVKNDAVVTQPPPPPPEFGVQIKEESVAEYVSGSPNASLPDDDPFVSANSSNAGNSSGVAAPAKVAAPVVNTGPAAFSFATGAAVASSPAPTLNNNSGGRDRIFGSGTRGSPLSVDSSSDEDSPSKRRRLSLRGYPAERVKGKLQIIPGRRWKVCADGYAVQVGADGTFRTVLVDVSYRLYRAGNKTNIQFSPRDLPAGLVKFPTTSPISENNTSSVIAGSAPLSSLRWKQEYIQPICQNPSVGLVDSGTAGCLGPAAGKTRSDLLIQNWTEEHGEPDYRR